LIALSVAVYFTPLLGISS